MSNYDGTKNNSHNVTVGESVKAYPPKASADEVEKSTVEAVSSVDVEEIIITPDEEKVDNVVELSKKYKFEGKIIDKIDLTGIENVSGETAQDIDKLYRKITKNVSSTPEFTPDYAMATASILTGLPVEFFKRISLKDITKMKNRVVNFLYGD